MSTGRLLTYQDIAGYWGVSVRTVMRWWKNRPKVHPTKNTVRITEREHEKFIVESGKVRKS